MRVHFSTPIWHIATVAMQMYEPWHNMQWVYSNAESVERGKARQCKATVTTAEDSSWKK